MKTLKLGSIKESYQQGYSLYLSPEHKFEFTSLKKAKIFQNTLEQILTEKLEIANSLLSDSFKNYRILFFQIDSTFELEQLFQKIDAIEYQFRLIYSGRYDDSNNGASFCYEKTKLIFQSLQSFQRSLHSIADLKKQISLKNSIAVQIRILERETKSLESLQKELFTTYKLTSDYVLRIVS